MLLGPESLWYLSDGGDIMCLNSLCVVTRSGIGGVVLIFLFKLAFVVAFGEHIDKGPSRPISRCCQGSAGQLVAQVRLAGSLGPSRDYSPFS
jgi:hypothetical protein